MRPVDERRWRTLGNELVAGLRRLDAVLLEFQQFLGSIFNQQEADNLRQHDYKHRPLEVSGKYRLPEEVEGKRQANDDRQYRVQKWLAVGTWLAFIAAVIYAGINYRMLSEMRKSTKAAQDALTVSQRPWVGITTPIHAEVIQFKQDEFGIRTWIPMKNFGPSPALKVMAVWLMTDPIMVHGGIIDEEGPVTEAIESSCSLAELVTEPELLRNGFTLFPSEELRQDRTQTVRIADPGAVPMAALGGCIVYRDQFNKFVHHTRFCLKSPGSFLSFKQTGVLETCSIGAGAD